MNNDRFLVLPDIRSCHNVGAMFRTADGAGFSKLFLCGYTAQPPKVQIDKVSLGAEMWVPWEYYVDAVSCVQQLKKKGVTIVALEQTTESRPLDSFEAHGPLALVVGNEVEGVGPELLAECDAAVHIPMLGKKKSLNVSIAAGIAMYALRIK